MVGRRISSGPTIDDSRSYIKAVKEAFHDEPAKYDEFLKLILDFGAHRVDLTSTIARVDELMKEHWNLLLRFYAFLPAEAKITIPPEAKITIPTKAKTTILPEAEQPTHSDALDFFKKVQEAFHGEPAKSEEFRKLMSDYRAHRLDRASLIAKLEELMKDRRDLLLGFNVYLPAGVNDIRLGW